LCNFAAKLTTHLAHKRIYIIRHGETDYNRRGIVQGSGVDADLNEMGRAQAEAFFQAYQHVPFDKIYFSTLRRTLQTIEPFIQLGLPHERHAGLNEISWGIMEGKVPSSLDDEYYRDLIESWAAGNTARTTDGGESPEQVRDRQKPVIDLILSRPEETTVLVAMHGRAMRILLSWLMNDPLANMDHYEHSNLCLYQLAYDADTKQFNIELANDTAHLMALVV
jgi:broad specificity phosphatase PhoE